MRQDGLRLQEMKRMKLTERLGKEWVFFDGGMGTILQEHGLKAG